MSRNHKIAAAVAVALGLIGGALFAFTSGDKPSTPGTTTTAGAPEPTTTEAPPPVAPLTGLPEPNAEIRNRPLLTVKIDNHPLARPQFGIDRADVIVEEKVEGGVSRFMALFHQQDVDRVGPVRSLRSTDPLFLKPSGGMIAYSGGIDPVKALLRPNGIVDLGADNHGVKYYKRRGDRPFEHSMYTITPVLRELTPKGLAAPRPLFQFLGPNESFGGAGVAPVSHVGGPMDGSATATNWGWDWDPSTSKFVRGTDGRAHLLDGGARLSMDNVIIQFTSYRATPWRDRAGSVVDEAVVVGGGDALVLSNGQLLRAKWSRPNPDAVTSYTDPAGAPVKVKPGHTWVALVPPGLPVTIR